MIYPFILVFISQFAFATNPQPSKTAAATNSKSKKSWACKIETDLLVFSGKGSSKEMALEQVNEKCKDHYQGEKTKCVKPVCE